MLKYIFIYAILTLSIPNVYGIAIADKFFSLMEGKSTSFVNCDSEYLRERDKHPDKDFSFGYWQKHIAKATAKNDHCRLAQIYFGLYFEHPTKYRELKGHQKTIEHLAAGNFFLELQWQIRNYREFYPTPNEYVEFLGVKSYWHYMKQLIEAKGCVSPVGYYEDRRGNRYNLVEEAQLSINTFKQKFTESKYLKVIDENQNLVRKAHVLNVNCVAGNVLTSYEKRKKSDRKPEHLWSVYTRLVPLVSHFPDQTEVSRSLYMMIKVCFYLNAHQEAGDTPVESYDFLASEDWNEKLDKLTHIMNEHYSKTEWASKAQEFLTNGPKSSWLIF